jgi:UDP-glucose 4-epimerase
MVGTKVLVTGGCGRIGGKLVAALVTGGDKVTVIDFKHGENKKVKYITAALNDIEKLEDFDIIYHLAASIDYKANKDTLKERNIDPTAKLLSLTKNCKQFIFMSTTSVYNESPEPITEETPTKPYSTYGWSKLECEELVKKSGIPYTIIRSSQVYGPEFKEGYADMLSYIQQGKLKILGHGKNYIPLVHVNDLIEALLLMRKNPDTINQIFNVDGNYQKTQNEFAELAAKALGLEPPTEHTSPAMAKLYGQMTGKAAFIVEYIDKLTKDRKISIEKIQKVGFKPKVTLQAGINDVIEAFRQEGLIQ